MSVSLHECVVRCDYRAKPTQPKPPVEGSTEEGRKEDVGGINEEALSPIRTKKSTFEKRKKKEWERFTVIVTDQTCLPACRLSCAFG